MIHLNHTIIPCSDKKISAHFYHRIFDFEDCKKISHFRCVRVNEQLTLLFDFKESFHPMHLAFKVDDDTFDKILHNIQKESLYYGSSYNKLENMKINHWHEGRGVYFRDPNGHLLELLTKDKD